jgi:NAD(P)-dependent dehydrogenase (short-subunit alcohol dehydrogenase family)
LEALAATSREQGKSADLLTVQTDLTEDAAADAISKATHGKFGRIDILVNNAGIGPGAIRPDSWQRPLKFWEITPDQWLRFVAVHATAPFALTNAVAPEMMRQGWGRIVNVTTSLGTMLNAGSPIYGPSKAALEALSAIMAKDLDGTGVTVNVLVPGGITNTPMVSDEAGFERAKMIQPEVMAPPLVWLISDAAGKVTVDGFSPCIGMPACRRKKRPRRLGHRSRGQASQRCRLRQAGCSRHRRPDRRPHCKDAARRQ